jgi:hypothetical protein
VPLITWPQRCSHPLCSSQSTDGRVIKVHREPITRPLTRSGREPFGVMTANPQLPSRAIHTTSTGGACSLRTQQCAAVPVIRLVQAYQRSTHMSIPVPRHSLGTRLWAPTPNPETGRWSDARMLLRKEVIQPHLPVRLPCYDFVPIASPTFDGSFPKGLGHRLRVLPTFVT